jgi:hypothetical protein
LKTHEEIRGAFLTFPRDADQTYFGWKSKKKRLAVELANKRLAMMAIIGMLFSKMALPEVPTAWALYKASPLRAFKSELDMQPPVGFWDPVSFTRCGCSQASSLGPNQA